MRPHPSLSERSEHRRHEELGAYRHANQISLQRYFNANPGVTVRSMKQQLIVYSKDAAGQSIKITLPKIFSVTYTKVNKSTVKIALQ